MHFSAVGALVGLAPVVAFLAALVWLDSYKLVSLRTVVVVVTLGFATAIASYFVNGAVLDATQIDRASLARYVAPVVEEMAKALVVIALVRSHRVGFLVDAAILGFAVGTGFALVENLQYQRIAPDAGAGVWIVRGFGTAIMHGGVTGIFAMATVAMLERDRPLRIAFAPALAVAIVLHSLYNHAFVPPIVATLAVLLIVPALMYAVFARSERAVGDWLGRGFDADAALLESMESGRFPDSPAGRYLTSLRDRFKGPVVADLLCYLRLHTELALRAKGLLMMRENGFDVPVDDETRAKFEEMRYLERSVGKTGRLALKPLLHASRRDLWQLNVLQ
jgi:protease PrsW